MPKPFAMITPVDLASTLTSTSPRVGPSKGLVSSSTCWRSAEFVVRWGNHSAEFPVVVTWNKSHFLGKDRVLSRAGSWGKKLPHLLLHVDGHVSRAEEDSFPWKRFWVQLSDHGTDIFWETWNLNTTQYSLMDFEVKCTEYKSRAESRYLALSNFINRVTAPAVKGVMTWRNMLTFAQLWRSSCSQRMTPGKSPNCLLLYFTWEMWTLRVRTA